MISKHQAVLSVVFATALAGTAQVTAESRPKPKTGLVRKGPILDLDADRGVKVVNGRVASWKNQVDFKAKTFIATRDANHEKGTGHPTLKEKATDGVRRSWPSTSFLRTSCQDTRADNERARS